MVVELFIFSICSKQTETIQEQNKNKTKREKNSFSFQIKKKKTKQQKKFQLSTSGRRKNKKKFLIDSWSSSWIRVREMRERKGEKQKIWASCFLSIRIRDEGNAKKEKSLSSPLSQLSLPYITATNFKLFSKLNAFLKCFFLSFCIHVVCFLLLSLKTIQKK